MDKFLKSTALFLFILVFAGCDEEDDGKKFLPSPSGQPGEVVIWCGNGFWEGRYGDSLRKHLKKPVHGLPQREPMFDLHHATDNTFSRVFKTFGNIVVLEIDEGKFTKPELKVERNVWAQRQAVIRLKAASKKELGEALIENMDDIVEVLNKAEANRIAKRHKDLGSEKLNKKIEALTGIRLYTMKDAFLAKEDSNAVWLRVERSKREGGFDHQISQGLLLLKTPYKSMEQLNDYAIYNLLDSALQDVVSGPVDDSYMKIDEINMDVKFDKVNYRGKYALEMSGLWRMHGYMMGGPWYALHIVDDQNNELISAFGYVYSPQFSKREYRREVEAAINSIQLNKE